MGILLAFVPFIAFAVVDKLIGPAQGLIAGAATSVGLLLRDWIGLHRKPKILEIGTAILFGGLALYASLGGPVWSIVIVLHSVRRRSNHSPRFLRACADSVLEG